MTKSSKAPFFLGGCGCLSILLSLMLLGGWFFFPDTSQWSLGGIKIGDGNIGGDDVTLSHYVNTPEGRVGSLAEYYVPFEFDYPASWIMKPQDPGSSNYVSVERTIGSDTCENFNVGYFQTTGSPEGNQILYPALIAQLQAQFEQQFTGLQKSEEGPTTIGAYDGWHALFQSASDSGSGSSDVFMRTVLLPTPDGTRGVAIIMMGTSSCPGLSQASDLGVQGKLPVVLQSFRFGV